MSILPAHTHENPKQGMRITPTARSTLVDRWLLAIWVRPNAAGGYAVLQSIVLFAVVAFSQDLTAFAPTWPPALPSVLVVARTLVLSGVVEESVFRVLLQPPGTSLSTILWTNLLFVLYHLVMAVAATKHFLDRPGVVRTFCDPTFLILCFVLGNLCSYSYRQAQYGLWAPVLVHTIPVAIWLGCLGGESALL
jgi:predicted Abi (CAAX) family protease